MAHGGSDLPDFVPLLGRSLLCELGNQGERSGGSAQRGDSPILGWASEVVIVALLRLTKKLER